MHSDSTRSRNHTKVAKVRTISLPESCCGCRHGVSRLVAGTVLRLRPWCALIGDLTAALPVWRLSPRWLRDATWRHRLCHGCRPGGPPSCVAAAATMATGCHLALTPVAQRAAAAAATVYGGCRYATDAIAGLPLNCHGGYRPGAYRLPFSGTSCHQRFRSPLLLLGTGGYRQAFHVAAAATLYLGE